MEEQIKKMNEKLDNIWVGIDLIIRMLDSQDVDKSNGINIKRREEEQL